MHIEACGTPFVYNVASKLLPSFHSSNLLFGPLPSLISLLFLRFSPSNLDTLQTCSIHSIQLEVHSSSFWSYQEFALIGLKREPTRGFWLSLGVCSCHDICTCTRSLFWALQKTYFTLGHDTSSDPSHSCSLSNLLYRIPIV